MRRMVYDASIDAADDARWGMEVRQLCPHFDGDECERCDGDPPAWGRCHFAPAPAEQGRLTL